MSETTTHTPGPWEVRGPDSDNDCSLHVYAKRGTWVATARPWSLSKTSAEEQQANAHLVAAAPDLLRWLTNALSLLGKTTEGTTEGMEVFEFCIWGDGFVSELHRQMRGECDSCTPSRGVHEEGCAEVEGHG